FGRHVDGDRAGGAGKYPGMVEWKTERLPLRHAGLAKGIGSGSVVVGQRRRRKVERERRRRRAAETGAQPSPGAKRKPSEGKFHWGGECALPSSSANRNACIEP